MRVLHALAADPARWRYGYELGTETGLKAGSLYPILVRLADRGLLEANWEESPPPGRPARHLYRLTPDGQDQARVAAPAAVPARAARAAQDSPAGRCVMASHAPTRVARRLPAVATAAFPSIVSHQQGKIDGFRDSGMTSMRAYTNGGLEAAAPGVAIILTAAGAVFTPIGAALAQGRQVPAHEHIARRMS